MNPTPLTAEQEHQLQAWRAAATRRMPYLAAVIYSLRPLSITSGTLAVDDRHRLYINFDYITGAGMSADQAGQALLHEACHVLADHASLAKAAGVGEGEHEQWNVAADAALNDDLRDAGCDLFVDNGGFVLPASIGQADYLTPIEYFRALRDQTPPPPQGGGDGDGESGADDQGQGGEGGQGQPGAACGSGAGAPNPVELDPDDDADGAAPGASAAEQARVKIATAAAIGEHQQNKGRGSVPAGLSEIAEQQLAPSETPWERLLASHVRRAVNTRTGPFDIDTSRRHRRRHRQHINDEEGTVVGAVVNPGTYSPVPSIHIVRDTSGSMSAEDLSTVTNEVEAIAAQLGVRGKELMVTDVDAAVHTSRPYTRARDLEQIHGRGGTDMSHGIEHALAARPAPTCVVVATDGYTPWPSTPSRIPVVAALIGHGTDPGPVAESVPDWIHTVGVPVGEN